MVTISIKRCESCVMLLMKEKKKEEQKERRFDGRDKHRQALPKEG